MADTHWTPLLVEERMVEAAEVLSRLPETRLRGYFGTWPPVVREFRESFGWHETQLRRPRPSPAAIDRMDEAFTWLPWLDPIDARIVWLRASGEPWKVICWKVGMARTAAHQHWMFGLCVIAWRLNGRRLPRNLSRRRVIEQTQASQS